MVKFWLWVKDEKGFYRMEPRWNIILPIFWHFIFTKAIWNIKKYTLPAFNILYMYIKSLLSWVWPLHINIYKPKHKTHPTNTQTLNLTMIVTGKTINSQPPKIYNNFQFHPYISHESVLDMRHTKNNVVWHLWSETWHITSPSVKFVYALGSANKV